MTQRRHHSEYLARGVLIRGLEDSVTGGHGPEFLWKVDSVGHRALFCIALPTSLRETDLPQPPFSKEGLRHLNFPSYSQRNTPVPYRWIGILYGTMHLLGPVEGLNVAVSE